jgi:hypothetical protein
MRPPSKRSARVLDYVERYLVNLGQVAGYRYAPFVTTVALPEVAELARQGRTLDAVRLYLKQTGANLEQGKDVIARMQAGDQPSSGSGPASPGQDAGLFGAAPAGYDAEPSFGPLTPPAGGLGVPADIVAMAQSGRLVMAIKAYKDRTGVSLHEAQATVKLAARGS